MQCMCVISCLVYHSLFLLSFSDSFSTALFTINTKQSRPPFLFLQCVILEDTMSVRESGKNDRRDGFSLKWCWYVCMTPLYKEVSHLHARTDRVRIRVWPPPEICLNVLITPSRGVFPSLNPTTGYVMGQAGFSRQGNWRRKKREGDVLCTVSDPHTQHQHHLTFPLCSGTLKQLTNKWGIHYTTHKPEGAESLWGCIRTTQTNKAQRERD